MDESYVDDDELNEMEKDFEEGYKKHMDENGEKEVSELDEPTYEITLAGVEEEGLDEEDMDIEELQEMEKDFEEGHYGGNKGDESRSHRDYETHEGHYGGNKGDMSKSRRDYETHEGHYGGNKGDESRSHRDYETNEGAHWGGNKDDYHREMGADGHLTPNG